MNIEEFQIKWNHVPPTIFNDEQMQEHKDAFAKCQNHLGREWFQDIFAYYENKDAFHMICLYHHDKEKYNEYIKTR